MKLVPYFAYGTTQKGFAHHRRFAGLLGEPVGRFLTVSAHAVVAPRPAACSNPGCQYVHRMAALAAGVEPLRVEGDLFAIGPEAVAVIDELETGSAGETLKRCCFRSPGHAPPHDVIDPLESVTGSWG